LYAYRRLRIPLEGLGKGASLEIGLRPGGLDAAVNLSDPTLADELRAHLHDLRKSLAKQGLEPRELAVRTTARDPGWEQHEGGERRESPDVLGDRHDRKKNHSSKNGLNQEDQHAFSGQ
jgi:hypothetical protein